PSAAKARRWQRMITTPAMALTWALGIALAIQGHWLNDGWLHAKLALVLLLTAIHGIQAGTLRRRAAGKHAGMWRITPLLVATAVIAILALVVVKPF
uniref:CopD family protein n=1 Tax=Bordetella sputigena TaxID=1416810 RepID=UPI0039EF3056